MTNDEIEEIRAEFKQFMLERFGDRFTEPNGGFILILVEENNVGLDSSFFSSYDVNVCPHCRHIVRKVFNGGLEHLESVIERN